VDRLAACPREDGCGELGLEPQVQASEVDTWPPPAVPQSQVCSPQEDPTEGEFVQSAHWHTATASGSYIKINTDTVTVKCHSLSLRVETCSSMGLWLHCFLSEVMSLRSQCWRPGWSEPHTTEVAHRLCGRLWGLGTHQPLVQGHGLDTGKFQARKTQGCLGASETGPSRTFRE
jgi:hypothetical protein